MEYQRKMAECSGVAIIRGKTRNSIRVYTHPGMGESSAVYGSLDEGSAIEKAAKVVEKGYNAVEVVFIPQINYTASLQEIKHVEKMMRTLRETVGNGVDLMI